MHVAINLIHPETFRAAHLFRDHERLAVMAAELEVEHGLTRTNHGLPAPGRARVPDAAATMRAHTGEEPFIDWVKRVAGPDLLEAGREDRGGWPALHVAAARHGLEIRPRGAGLVIGKRGEPALMMRASDLDRSMSFGRLAGRLGAYQPAGAAVAAVVPENTYERTVRPEHRGEPGRFNGKACDDVGEDSRCRFGTRMQPIERCLQAGGERNLGLRPCSKCSFG